MSNFNQPKVVKGSLRRLRPSPSQQQQVRNNNPYNKSPFQNQNQNSTTSKPISKPIPKPQPKAKAKSKFNDSYIRKSWKSGSKVEVFSSGGQKWYEGDIVRIFNDDEGEWLEVQYAAGNSMRLKQIPRNDADAIRPIPSSISEAQSSSLDSNTGSLSATAVVGSGSSTIYTNNNKQNNLTSNNSTNKPPNINDIDDIDEQIRNSWVRGSRVEVYSRGRKTWMRGLVTRVFNDDEGEWLEVRYGKNLVKETPRDSPDIRPLRIKYKNRYKWTKEHENLMTAIWEDVDLEKTRHLDRMLVSSVFRAVNINSSVCREEELDDVFNLIDKEERGAITVDEFVSWMTNAVETIKHREIQQKIFDSIDLTTKKGITDINLIKFKKEEKKKLTAVFKSQFGKDFKKNNNDNTSSNLGFTPSSNLEQKQMEDNMANNWNNSNPNDDYSNNEHEPMEIDAEEDEDNMAQFSDNDEDNEEFKDDQVSELNSKNNNINNPNLSNKLKDVGFSDKFLVATVESQKEEYHSKLSNISFIDNLSSQLKDRLNEIQTYMKMRVRKAGVDGMRMSELGNVLHKKFDDFDKRKFISNKKATLSDFVSLCPGLVVVEMEGSNRRMERIAVTDACALKINLKSKLQFVLTMLFDKGKITNSLEPIKLSRDPTTGRIIKQRRLSVGERLISVEDFTNRIRSLGVDFNKLEGDELFWAVAGSNSTMISQKMVGRYFSSLIDHLDENLIEPQVSLILPKVINLARLRYRREPLWKKYIIIRTISRWNNISYLRLTDRRTRTKLYDMIVIPRTKSVHGGNILDVQKSFHYTCHILNKLQYPTICKKIDHGSDKFNFCCVTKTPHLRSFPEMLSDALTKRNIVYSEYFISQVIGCVFETILFCHKHNTVNFNLNIDSLGFDNNLRPILLDFSRSIVLNSDIDDDEYGSSSGGDNSAISRFDSVMSSTPPELALLMGSNNPLMNIELNGSVLKKADSWRCGVLLYVLITGKLPYTATSLGSFITNVLTLPPVIPIENINWCSSQLKDLLSKLLETTYFNRIDITDALKHKWFTEYISSQKDNPISLPTNIQNNIINLCKLETARNWISTITHSPKYDESLLLDRNRKYFGRLDPTGQRKSLKKDKLEIFIMDRFGYCKYRAHQIIYDEYFINHNNSDQINWKEFVKPCYNEIQLDGTGPKQFTNAIYRGLDPDGNGYVDSELLLMLFEDINLKLQSVENKLKTISKFTFEQCVSELSYSFKNGFDIKDLLSVDHVVQSL